MTRVPQHTRKTRMSGSVVVTFFQCVLQRALRGVDTLKSVCGEIKEI